MNERATLHHVLVVLSSLLGICGMGLLWHGVTEADPAAVLLGLPLLGFGLYWSGRDLGRSMKAARERGGRSSSTSGGRSGGASPDIHDPKTSTVMDLPQSR